MWSSIVLVVVVALMVVIYRKISKSRKYWETINKIPGPKGKPIIGNFLTTYTTPENMFKIRRQWAREYFPIYKVISLNVVYVAVMTPEDMETVLTNRVHDQKGIAYSTFTNWLGSGLLISQGQLWKKRRRILTPGFHFNILQEFIEIFNKEAEHMLEDLEKRCKGPYVDVIKPITEFTLCSIIATSMGIKLNEQETSESYKNALLNLCEIFIHRLTRPWLLSKSIYHLSSVYQEERHYLDILHGFSDKVVTERKKNFDNNHNTYSSKKRQAMLDLLLSAQMSGIDIDDAGIRDEVDTFLFGGHDTTSVALSYTLMSLANEPHIQEEVLNEIYEVLGDSGKLPTYADLQQLSYMERCIKETMRLYPSIPLINRIAGEDIKSSTGYTIPKGTNVFLLIYDLHRNPDVWENPLKYDPDRFLPENARKRHTFSYIPFSAGPRNCIGQKFALVEIKVALCAILRKFKLEPVDTPESLRYKTDIVLRPSGEVKVKFIPRKE